MPDSSNPDERISIRAHYYQQFDADHSCDVPAESYGGWKSAVIGISRVHTALVVMHAWDTGTPETYPGWWRAVEYMSRAERIVREVFPPLLKAVRSSGMRLYHVTGGGGYGRRYRGYEMARDIGGPEPPPPVAVPADAVLAELRAFRDRHVFPGTHNEADVARGFENLDFPHEARPLDDEPVVENGHQLLAICRYYGTSHLIYAGFALNWCLLLSPGGMAEMSRYGIMCSVLREATTAVENRETARTEMCKQIALWRVALAFGFVFDVQDFIRALSTRA